MKSKKTISFISWNTIPFLYKTLDSLYNEQIVQYFITIEHKAEEDEKKDHSHVILFPNVSIDYMDLKIRFCEPQLHGLQPLGISFRPQYVGKDCEYDWLLYNLHDPNYIRSKYKEMKKYSYKPDDFYSPDINTLEDMIYQAYHTTDFYKDKVINDLLKNGVSPTKLIDNGYIPIKDACSYHHYFQMTKEG